MDTRQNLWCAVPQCTKKFNLGERNFFRFPKERDRWLQWVRACGRLDLEPKGPEYAYQNCRLCQLHFEEKWYNKNKIRARLHPDAVPTIFFGPGSNKKDNTIGMETDDNEETNGNTYSETNKTMKEKNSNMESAETLPIVVNNVDAEIVKPSTSKGTKEDAKSSENSPRKKKLRMKIAKLKTQNKTFRVTIRRLRLEKKKMKKTQAKEEANEQETLKKLGCKLLPDTFNKILAAQIDAQCKRKRGRRYDPEFKKFALSLYFLSPRNYRELKKSIALPSVRSLHLFTETWNVVPGINDKIFEALKVKLNTLPLMERHCILCVDKMSLKAHLFYNVSRDEIIGFEDLSDRKTSIPAKSALVLMARSIAGDWKLPVCFCLVETACPSEFLKNIILTL